MRDPLTQAFSNRLFTVWHHDPETDGTDDSCGWFKRARHGNHETLKAIEKLFAFDWDTNYGGLFDSAGNPIFSTQGIVLNLFFSAAYCHFGCNREKSMRFIKRNLCEILLFAENPSDSLCEFITGKYGFEPREDRIKRAAGIIYGWILRAGTRWWQHPRWHIHHWRLQIIPLQSLKRRFWDKCDICGKRGFPKGTSAIGNWNGDRIWHDSCDRSGKPSPQHAVGLSQ